MRLGTWVACNCLGLGPELLIMGLGVLRLDLLIFGTQSIKLTIQKNYTKKAVLFVKTLFLNYYLRSIEWVVAVGVLA